MYIIITIMINKDYNRFGAMRCVRLLRRTYSYKVYKVRRRENEIFHAPLRRCINSANRFTRRLHTRLSENPFCTRVWIAVKQIEFFVAISAAAPEYFTLYTRRPSRPSQLQRCLNSRYYIMENRVIPKWIPLCRDAATPSSEKSSCSFTRANTIFASIISASLCDN